ncbi:MAG: hypothetical protein U9N60_10465 [Thermodesulfobacteriota bacterium]|nr:hypothetical protein [Thermodesulfobacteriota bacterium]
MMNDECGTSVTDHRAAKACWIANPLPYKTFTGAVAVRPKEVPLGCVIRAISAIAKQTADTAPVTVYERIICV